MSLRIDQWNRQIPFHVMVYAFWLSMNWLGCPSVQKILPINPWPVLIHRVLIQEYGLYWSPAASVPGHHVLFITRVLFFHEQHFQRLGLPKYWQMIKHANIVLDFRIKIQLRKRCYKVFSLGQANQYSRPHLPFNHNLSDSKRINNTIWPDKMAYITLLRRH